MNPGTSRVGIGLSMDFMPLYGNLLPRKISYEWDLSWGDVEDLMGGRGDLRIGEDELEIEDYAQRVRDGKVKGFGLDRIPLEEKSISSSLEYMGFSLESLEGIHLPPGRDRSGGMSLMEENYGRIEKFYHDYLKPIETRGYDFTIVTHPPKESYKSLENWLNEDAIKFKGMQPGLKFSIENLPMKDATVSTLADMERAVKWDGGGGSMGFVLDVDHLIAAEGSGYSISSNKDLIIRGIEILGDRLDYIHYCEPGEKRIPDICWLKNASHTSTDSLEEILKRTERYNAGIVLEPSGKELKNEDNIIRQAECMYELMEEV